MGTVSAVGINSDLGFNKLIHINTNNSIINVDLDLSLLSIKWHPFTESPDVKASFILAAKMAKAFYIRRILHDTTNLSYLSIDIHNWLLREIVPQFLSANVKKFARIVSEEPMAFLVSSKYFERIKANFAAQTDCKCELFTDYSTAMYWLNI
ncbi:hypothetical protein [Adhaeribacter aquaticus]|uniref:hypothetical protein n=1 Tax=Adhaeribacter aquaticus TaxID=299567 RepID=UPI00047A7F25|nr:hypothetical protein [Adhaeribacter aquaticus]